MEASRKEPVKNMMITMWHEGKSQSQWDGADWVFNSADGCLGNSLMIIFVVAILEYCSEATCTQACSQGLKSKVDNFTFARAGPKLLTWSGDQNTVAAWLEQLTEDQIADD